MGGPSSHGQKHGRGEKTGIGGKVKKVREGKREKEKEKEKEREREWEPNLSRVERN